MEPKVHQKSPMDRAESELVGGKCHQAASDGDSRPREARSPLSD